MSRSDWGRSRAAIAQVVVGVRGAALSRSPAHPPVCILCVHLYCVYVGPPTRPGGYLRVFSGPVKVGRRPRRVPCARAVGFFPQCNVTTNVTTDI